jgi:hydroxymethylpyrimidine pyrophosphatase-like HAD family hydrolase
MLGLSREGDTATGDHETELPMFMHAGVSVVVANAGRTMQGAARFVVPSNEGLGVLVAVERFVKGDCNV